MSDLEFLWCADCEDADCECGGGFYEDEGDEFEAECPCCGSMEVAP